MRTSYSPRSRARARRAALALAVVTMGVGLPSLAGAAGLPPTGTITTPELDQSYNAGPATLTGTASDDAGVASVELVIRNRDTQLILQANGSFSTNNASGLIPAATLSNPGAPSTSWSYTWPAAAPGNYNIAIRIKDVGSPTTTVNTPTVRFGVVGGTGSTTPPDLVNDMGGPLHAEFYSSGLELSPPEPGYPQGTIVIADTGNNQVAKLDPATGAEIWRRGAPGPDANEFWHPRDVSVAADGRIFVIDTENERIVRLAPNGDWLGTFNGPAENPARFYLGGTITGNKFYMADLGGRIRVFDLEGNQLPDDDVPGNEALLVDGVMEELPGTECADLFDIRDAAADSAGNVYVAGYRTNSIMVFSPKGECLDAFGTTGTGDGQFKTPYGVYIKVDPILNRELVYVTDALNARVQVFELNGTFVGKFGTPGPGSTEGTLYTLRRAAPALDGSGDVWVADLWAFRLQRYDRTAAGWTYAQTIGANIGTTTNDTVFHEPRGLAVDANGLVNVMDTVHHRLVRMNQNGTLAVPASCGSRGDGDGQFNWPRDVTIDNATGDVWIADTKKNRVEVLKSGCAFVAARGSAGSGNSQFSWPRALEIRQSDRTLWVADTQNNRITVWSVATKAAIGKWGTTQGNGLLQFNRPMGIAVDPTTGNILVADTVNNRIAVMAADTGGTNIRLLRYLSFDFNEPEAVAVAPDGTIYVADTADSEIVVLAPGGGALLATFGTADGLDHPSGVATDADGKIFVSDSFNDRVLIYSHDDWTPPPVDSALPVATVTSPTASQVLTSSPITFTGNATDDTAVASVKLGIKNVTTNQWWDGTAWVGTPSATVNATLSAPGTGSTGWSYVWTPPASGSYALQVTVLDQASKANTPKPWVTFQYNPAPTDTINPTVTVGTPTNNQVFGASPVNMKGTATDNVAVSTVKLVIRNSATQYWTGTAWQAAYFAVNAVLATPGGATTNWTYAWAPPATGTYTVQVFAIDSSNRSTATNARPLRTFSYNPAPPDTAAPNGLIDAPTAGQIFNIGAPSIVFSGTATDDLSVASVRLTLRKGTNQWWNGTGWQATTTTFNAVLAAPGTTSTGWSYTWALPAGTVSTQYTLQAQAVDGFNKVDASVPSRSFRARG